MGAEELSPKNEDQPSVIIAALEGERFSSYQQKLEEAGYSAQIVDKVDEVLIQASQMVGAIVFISWNLGEKRLQAILNVLKKVEADCIVFAEKDDMQTAASLASFRYEKKMQAPFAEKNFVMTVQSICRDRQVQREKEERRQRHLERFKKSSEENNQGPKVKPMQEHHSVAPEPMEKVESQTFETEKDEVDNSLQTFSKEDSEISGSAVQEGPASEGLMDLFEGEKSDSIEPHIPEPEEMEKAPLFVPEPEESQSQMAHIQGEADLKPTHTIAGDGGGEKKAAEISASLIEGIIHTMDPEEEVPDSENFIEENVLGEDSPEHEMLAEDLSLEEEIPPAKKQELKEFPLPDQWSEPAPAPAEAYVENLSKRDIWLMLGGSFLALAVSAFFIANVFFSF